MAAIHRATSNDISATFIVSPSGNIFYENKISCRNSTKLCQSQDISVDFEINQTNVSIFCRMIELHENGILKHLRKRHDHTVNVSGCSGAAEALSSSVPLMSVWPCFVILACGSGLSIFLLLLECVYMKINPGVPHDAMATDIQCSQENQNALTQDVHRACTGQIWYNSNLHKFDNNIIVLYAAVSCQVIHLSV